MSSPFSQTLQIKDAWSMHVHEILQSLDISSDLLAGNISKSVGTYCRQFYSQGVQRSDLILLIARAYCAVNERETAERVISSLPSHRRFCSRWLEILSELHHFPSLLPYFSRGIIRPADWAGAWQDRMWVLDLTQLMLLENEAHEMMLYRSVRNLIEHMYVFWDATKGEGILGLKGVAIQQDTVSGMPSGKGNGGDDLLIYISDLFLRQQSIRGWISSPSILQLDRAIK